MKHQILILIFFVAITISAQSNLTQTTKILGADYKNLAATETTSRMPQYANELYPLGFSRDSRFAYIQKFNTDAMVFWRLVVVNIISDKVQERLLWDSDPSFVSQCEECDFEGLLKIKEKEIQQILAKYNIIPSQVELRQNGSATFNNINYSITTFMANSNDKGQPHLTSPASISVNKRGSGSKKVGTVKVNNFENIIPVGFIKSPFESRAVTIVLCKVAGSEGTTEKKFKLFGCNLTKGFKL